MSCPICGRIKANSPHHIIPKSEGGGSNKENITYLCKKCHDEVEEDPRKWARFLRHYYTGAVAKRRIGRTKELPRAYSNKKTIMLTLSEASSPGGPLEGSGQLKFIWNPDYNSMAYKLIHFPLGSPSQENLLSSRRGSREPNDRREGTISWLASKLGISGRVIRAILRAKYPRGSELKWSPWGVLTQEQQNFIWELKPVLDKVKLANLVLALTSNTIEELLNQKLDHENSICILLD